MTTPTLLHVDSSVQATASATRQLTAALAQALARAHPALEPVYRDLAADPLPHFVPPAPDHDPVLAQFQAARVVIIGAPMYNFTIPSQLKAWIDRIVVAGETFEYLPDGSARGLATGKTVYLAIAAGGEHPMDAPPNFVEPYLRAVLGFMGITDIHAVRAPGMAMGQGHRDESMARALEHIQHLPDLAA